VTMANDRQKVITGFFLPKRYCNTTVYCGILERSECIPVDSGVTNLTHDCCSCVYFTLGSQANVGRCVHSKVNKPGTKVRVCYETLTHSRLYSRDTEKK